MKKFYAILLATMSIVFLSGSGGQGPEVQATSFQPSSIPSSASLKINQDFGKMPLYFILNQGQVDARVAYYIQGKDKTIYFTSEGLTYVLSERRAEEAIAEKTTLVKEHLLINPMERELRSRKDQRRYAVKLDFEGANKNVRPSGEEKTGAVISYFKGKPEEWKSGLPTYARIVYKDLWPGIDAAYYGTMDKMKYEFIVHPGSDPSLIRLAYRGASVVEVNGEDRLEVRTPAGGFADDRPVGYQEIDGDRVEVAMSYLLEDRSAKDAGPGGEEAVTKSYVYGFEVGDYDRTKPLVLDPAVLVYCGYIGGDGWDYGCGIAVDGSGNAYVTGLTSSSETTFPVGLGPDLTHNGIGDAFVAKVNASGTVLVYCGYIGGSGYDYGSGIEVDGSGNAYVTGYTYSDEATFPVVGGPDLTYNGDYDAFVAKVNASGTALVYCGYIGGKSGDFGNGIAVDSSRNAYITGSTNSTEATFPVVGGPDLTHNGNSDAFVAKVNASGTALVYCGYISGSASDGGYGIAVDGSGNAYVAGETSSDEATFPVIGGPDLTYKGNADAFVAKVNAFGTALVYCGYIGGFSDDDGSGIAVDGSGNAYVTGYTYSDEATFPVFGGPDLTQNGYNDAYIAKVNASGTALVYCGYIGGSNKDWGNGIAVDGSGNAYITGSTFSTEATFPVVGWPDLTHNGGHDVFVAKVNASGTALVYCGYIGGSSDDLGQGIAVDGSGNAYVTGRADSTEATFPVLGGPDLTFNGGNSDVFVAKISSIQNDDFVGTWDGQGVYYRNSDSGAWVKLASPATLIAGGDLDGDCIDDVIGIWPGQGGVWVKYSASGSWALLSSTAKHIAAGDMNGDGRPELLGTWDGQGVYWRDNTTGAWTQMATPATLITSGDLDGDGTDDLIGIWPSQGGVWVKYSQSGSWAKLSTTAVDIATGDMNGDGRDDLLATWDGQGVYYRNSIGGAWVKMATPATQVTAGDLDGDGTDDVIGIWPSQAGVWVKYSQTGAWAKLSSTAVDIAAGKMRAAGSASLTEPGATVTGSEGDWGPDAGADALDLSTNAPGGMNFFCPGGDNLEPRESGDVIHIHGPGEPGFRCLEQKNLVPGSGIKKEPKEKEQYQLQ